MTSLEDVASYLPQEPHLPGADMVERAVYPLRRRHGDRAIREVDALLVHSAKQNAGEKTGVEAARRLGAHPEWLVDLRNGGAAAFVYLLKLARQLVNTGARTALVCALDEGACGIGYLTASGTSPVLAVECRHGVPPEEDDERCLPAEVLTVCGRIGIPRDEIDVLITNQPSRARLRSWRDALSLPDDRHWDTFAEHGDLAAVALPVTLEQGIREARLKNDDLVVLAGCATAGECVGAVAVRWRVSGPISPALPSTG